MRMSILFLAFNTLTFLEALAAPDWSVVQGPNPPGCESLLRAVEAISDEEAWAVGTVQSPSPEYDNRTLIAHYVNGAWTVVPSPNPGSASAR